MKKITEHTYGTHIYMKMMLDDGPEREIDVYLRNDGKHYKTSGDGDEKLREQIIAAFNELY